MSFSFMTYKADTGHENIVTKTVGHESTRLNTTGQNHRKDKKNCYIKKCIVYYVAISLTTI